MCAAFWCASFRKYWFVPGFGDQRSVKAVASNLIARGYGFPARYHTGVDIRPEG